MSKTTTQDRLLEYPDYLNERRALADAESEVSSRFDRSLLTLSGGALLLSMTFVKEIASKPHNTWTLFVAWLLLGWAICLMLISLLTSQSAFRRQRDILDDRLDRKAPARATNRYASMTHWLNLVSMTCFGAALGFMSYFIWANMPGK